MQVSTHHLVKDSGETITTDPPLLDSSEAKFRGAPEPGEILMSDCIAPLIQLHEVTPESLLGVIGLYVGPELDIEPAEIRADTAWMGITLVQLTIPDEFRAEDRLQVKRSDQTDQDGHALVMKVAAESLEVRREQDDISLIDLLRRVPTTAARGTDRAVRVLDPIQLTLPGRSPLLVRFRRHLFGSQLRP
jgi:hypothetical protein